MNVNNNLNLNLNLIESKFVNTNFIDKKNISNDLRKDISDNISDNLVSDYNNLSQAIKENQSVFDIKEAKIREFKGSKDELKNELKKYLKKFNKKLIIKTFSKVPYGVAGYFTADKVILKSLKYGAPVIEAVFAYKDYHHKIQEGKSKFSAALETISSFVSGVGVSYLVGSAISGPLGFALSVSLGALAGVLADKLASKVSSYIENKKS